MKGQRYIENVSNIGVLVNFSDCIVYYGAFDQSPKLSNDEKHIWYNYNAYIYIANQLTLMKTNEKYFWLKQYI